MNSSINYSAADRSGAQDLTQKHRPDCCDNCRMETHCNLIPPRCWPNGELIEQCGTCVVCHYFIPKKVE